MYVKNLYEQWYYVAKIVLTYCEKKYVLFSDQEKLLKFEAAGRDFAKFFRSLEQFIQTVTGQNNCLNKMLPGEQICQTKIRIQMGENYWDLETSRKNQKI